MRSPAAFMFVHALFFSSALCSPRTGFVAVRKMVHIADVPQAVDKNINSEYRWPSYSNLQQQLIDLAASPEKVGQVYGMRVCVTEKLHGSNLGIHIAKVSGRWSLKELLGRNTILWSDSGSDSVYDLSYGFAEELLGLPDAMFEFAQNLGDRLSKSDICVYGEVIRINGSKFPSWHPFGYKITHEKTNYVLTSEVHESFVAASNSKTFSTHQDFCTFVESFKGHAILPPPILFKGTLGDAIDELYPTMKLSSSDFEGVMIVAESAQLIAKWKTAHFEEQPCIPSIESVLPSCVERYAKLISIYEDKRGSKPAYKESLGHMLEVAFQREASKQPTWGHIDKKFRHEMLGPWTAAITSEVLSHYASAGISAPWPAEEVESKAQMVVKRGMFSVPFAPSSSVQSTK